jgi:formylglycine-generating enzyme
MVLAAAALLLYGAAPQTPAYVEAAIDARMVLVTGGTFVMGSRYAESVPVEAERKFFQDEAPPHEVKLTRDFWVSDREITIGQFRRFVSETGYVTTAEKAGESLGEYQMTTDAQGKTTGSWVVGKRLNWKNPGWQVTDEHPVTHVSWEDAAAFCAWLSEKTGREYRLLTEAEWEYAAAGPRRTLYSWGDHEPNGLRGGNIADAAFAATYPQWKYPVHAAYDDTFTHTAPTGSFAPNAFGLHDMSGNVCEWCSDLYGATYYGESPAQDPSGAGNGTERVHRGAGFDWELPYLRITKRRRGAPTLTACNIGFRIARTAK